MMDERFKGRARDEGVGHNNSQSTHQNTEIPLWD